MILEQQTTSKLNHKLKIKITKDDYAPKLNNALKKYAKTSTIKGFRPGMVPVGMVKKMYGNQILAEELNNLIQESIDKHIKENNLNLLGFPIPVEDHQADTIDATEEKDYEFDYELGVAPEFSLDYGMLKGLTKYSVEVSESMINDEVDRLRKRYGKMQPTEDIQEEDMVYVDFVELDETGAEKAEGYRHASVISTIDMKDSNVVLGKKSGDEIILNPFEVFDEEKINVSKYILNLTEEQKAAINPTMKMIIKNINRMDKAELNEDFYKKVFGEGVTNFDEFKAKISNEIAGFYTSQAENKLSRGVYEELVSHTKMDFPVDFLKRWIKKTNEKPITDEMLEKDYPLFENELKWDLITNKIAKEQDYKIEPAEIRAEMRSKLLSQLYSYGMYNYTEDQLNDYVQKMMQDKKQVQGTIETLLDLKVLGYIKTQFTAKEEKVSLEEFNKHMQEAHVHNHAH